MTVTNAGLILVGFLFIEMLRLLAAHIFKKFTSTDFITHDDCHKCSEKKEAVFAEVKEDIRVMKKVLFVVAVRVGVEDEEIKQLVG